MAPTAIPMCVVCQHESDVNKEYGAGVEKRKIILCYFCSNTFAGNVAAYPDNYSPEQKLTAMMAAQTYWMLRNYIDVLERRREGKDSYK